MNKIEFYSNLAKFEGRNGDAFLKHYGIIGQKWGQRRWQNPDGTFNTEGKIRYFGSKKAKNEKKINSKYQNEDGSLTQEYINKIQKLTNEGKFDELEKLKKQIDFDKVQEWSKKANPNLYKTSEFSDPSDYEDDFESYAEDNWEIAAKKRGFDTDDILTDEQYEIINKDLKDYFYKNEDQVGSIFNKKNVNHWDDKYRTYKMKDMDADDNKLQDAEYEALIEDLNTYNNYYLNKMKKDTNLPEDFIEKYYRNVKSDAIEELSKKYPNIAPDKLLSVDKFNDDEYLQEQGDSYACRYSKETDDKIKELEEKRDKYPRNSAKWNKIDSEIERVEHQEWIKNSKQEKEFYKDLAQYIENNYNKIKEEAQEQYKRNPEWEPADDAVTSNTETYYYSDSVGTLTTTAEKEYGYKYNKDKFNTITLDKKFKSKDDGNINLKLDIDEYQDGGVNVKQMKQRMKNNEKFIKNFDKTNDYIRSEVADWLYDQYCDDMEYYDKKPLSYEKFLNKINLQPNIDSTYYSKDENKYHAIYHLNIPGYDQYCGVDFVGDGRYVDIDSLD